MSDYITKRELEETFDKKLDDFAVKLFKYFDKQFAAQRQDFESLRGDFRSLQSLVLQYAKDVEIYHDESKARDYQVARIQGWVEQLAAQAGLKLEY